MSNAYIRNDKTGEVVKGLAEAIRISLEEAGTVVENAAARDCPVDTGRLRNSLTHQMDGDKSVQVGSDVEYAAFVECGTSRAHKQPYLRPALENNAQKIQGIFKKNLG